MYLVPILQCLFAMRRRLGRISHLKIGDGQVIMGNREPWSDFNGFFAVSDAVFDLTLPQVGAAQVTQGLNELRVLLNGLFEHLDRLVDLAERSAVAELPAPETLRRLAHSVLEHQGGVPTDDATILLVEWSEKAAERTLP